MIAAISLEDRERMLAEARLENAQRPTDWRRDRIDEHERAIERLLKQREGQHP
ncbi:hypothetical protein [Fulvimarina endophytica]|uniref:hypothetical protein n=1 Tax=Fulvimarina endophytica TaxID=2293836 RepID=UPI00131424A2|nr:hypothetical protein [Fulvimarina endophytica]